MWKTAYSVWETNQTVTSGVFISGVEGDRKRRLQSRLLEVGLETGTVHSATPEEIRELLAAI